MKKAILLGASILVLTISMSSCKKCYMCALSQQKVINSQDTLVVLRTELCNKGSEGAGTNLNVTVADVEANGYICTPE
jgi:hypothetical protein